jgi:hypothetical protein
MVTSGAKLGALQQYTSEKPLSIVSEGKEINKL